MEVSNVAKETEAKEAKTEAKTKGNKFEQKPVLRHRLAQVVRDGDHLEIEKQLYLLLTNQGDALDLELLKEKYDPYLNRYDFLVGDLSSDHLRLKGFYKNEAQTAIDRKEMAIADYLEEYCNPGAPYFILQLIKPEHHYQHRQRRRRNSRRKQNHFKERRVRQVKIQKKQTVVVKKGQANHHSFVIKKRKG